MDVELMLTTIDNPYDPFTEYNEWYAWDTYAGYHTTQYLARIVITSDELSEADQTVAINNAIKEICELNVLGVYKSVERRVGGGGSEKTTPQPVSARP